MSTIITRAGKGSPLTNNEVDANFNNLNSTKVETSAVGTLSTQNANSVAITGGAVNNTTVGSTTAAAGSFTTLNSSGATRLGGLSGNQSLQVNNVASAVNYAQVIGATTGGYPAIQGQGTDANVGLLFDAKGNASQFFRAQGGAIQFAVGALASAVNYISASGNVTSGFPTLSAVGADANVGFVFNAKGTASVAFQTSSTLQAQVSHTASAVNYLNLTGAATGAAPTISAQGSDANINLNLTPKGSGTVNAGASIFSTTAGINIGSSNNYIYQSSASTLQFRVGTTPAYFGFVDNSGAMGITSGNAILFTGTGGTTFRIANSVASSVNYVQVDSATTTNAPALSAQGSDANINLKLTPKGTGVLQFGTYTAGVLTPTGYITITDAGGTSRRLLVG